MAELQNNITDKTYDIDKLAKQFNQRSFAAPIDWSVATNGFDLSIVSELLVKINAEIREPVIKLFCGLYQQFCMEHTSTTLLNDKYVTYSCNIDWERDLRNLLAQKIENKNMFSAFCRVTNEESYGAEKTHPLKIRLELVRKLLSPKNLVKFLKLENASKAKYLSIILGNSVEKIRGLLSTPEDVLIPKRYTKEVEDINAMLKKDGFNAELRIKKK